MAQAPSPDQVVDQLQATMGPSTTEEEERPSGPISGVWPAQLENHVANEAVLATLHKEVLVYVKQARDNRAAKVEQDWLRYRDIYNLRRTTTFYEGRSKLFIPAIKKAVDVLTRIAKEAIFSDPYLGIETEIPRYKDAAMELMKWLLEDQAKVKDKMAMFLRQLYQIGTSCIKVTWKKSRKTIKYREWDQELNQSIIQERKEHDYYGPKVEVVDMRHVYVWPESAVDYDGFQIVFEDSTIRESELLDKAAEGVYDAVAVQAALSRRSESLAAKRASEGQPAREGLSNADNLPPDVMDITYIWAKFKLPGQEDPQWNQIIMLNDNPADIIRVSENPWWFQKPNYLFGTLFQEHDYFYGHGIIEMLEMWQYMVNDVANQTMDVNTFCLNPITAYDPGMIDDPDQLEVQPMAKWPVPPKSVEIIRPPIELAQQGVNMLTFLINIIQESSDATALVQGAPRVGLGRATNTATGVNQLFQSASSAILDQVDSLQSQVLTPLAHMVEIMAHEFIDEDMVIRKVGDEGVVITQRIVRPQDLILSTDVRWIASNRLREKSAKVQQMLNFLNIAIGIPPQLTAQQGFQIRFKEIIKDLYAGMGLPNPDRVIQDMLTAIPGIPPEYEQELLDAGRSVIASPVALPQDHEMHLQVHMQYRPATELARIRLMEHIASHYQGLQQSMAQQAEQAGGKGGPGTAMEMLGGAPMRPQEQPIGDDSDAMSGVLSQVGMG